MTDKEQNAWQELRRKMECLSDRPFHIAFIKGNENNNCSYPQSEITQSENTAQPDLISSSYLKTLSDASEESKSNGNISEVEKKMDPLTKFSLCHRVRQIQSSNVAQLNNIFNTDTRKTVELSSKCKEIINRELMFWHDRIQFEMRQTVAIMSNLSARMERIKKLNQQLRDLLAYFNDDTDSSVTSSTY
ncbi:Uncharacterized protein BM_BM1092 [Brugia malayi]|uniref:Bm1092 n=3 Tax=Brugia TaxID=6278 RepID=A0A0K0IQ00_BRUMA|nr:Uncharacterized protein BM_BM1092 [Brugia malayi]CDQ03211.1 Bm1092 [Brugia malayi]VDO38912.1 unnamed protein product [Brugia timori]VIO92652.1 Uncharacterized protein BM_BM1092 [Brugia malayi]